MYQELGGNWSTMALWIVSPDESADRALIAALLPELEDDLREYYALRYVEMMTGHRLDPGDFPSWIGEWAVF